MRLSRSDSILRLLLFNNRFKVCWLKKTHNLNIENYVLFSRLHLKLMTLMLFYVWEDARVWAYWNHSFDMYLNYLGQLSCFSPSWIPLREYWGGQLQWLMSWWQQRPLFTEIAGNIYCPQSLLFTIISTNVWEAFHDQFCPTALQRLIPRPGEDSVDRPFNVIIFGLSLVDNLKFFGSPVLLVYYDPGNVSPCCFSPYVELHHYNYSI